MLIGDDGEYDDFKSVMVSGEGIRDGLQLVPVATSSSHARNMHLDQ